MICNIIPSPNPQIGIYLLLNSLLIYLIRLRVHPDQNSKRNHCPQRRMVHSCLRIVWWLEPFVSVLELPHVLTLLGFIDERIDVVVVWREPTRHVWPVVFNIWSLVVVFGWKLFISDWVLSWMMRDVLPLMMRGGLAGLWKYRKVGLMPFRQCRNINNYYCQIDD